MLRLGAGTALQANYGHRIWQGDTAAVYAEVHFLGNPQRLVTAPNQTLTRDVATIFLTPGVRVKFRPLDAVSPYVVGGGGYAVFEQSLTRLDGQPNGAPRTIGRGAFMFGGGVDVKLWRFIALRVEARDFYSGSPAYNTSSLAGGQHNVTIGGGVVLRLR
jgi:opacity protein-like surface antigen